MIKVIVVNDKKITKQFQFNERKDEHAVRKAFIELDRAVWSYETGDIIALYQNNQLLRHYCDDQGWVFTNNNGIYDY